MLVTYLHVFKCIITTLRFGISQCFNSLIDFIRQVRKTTLQWPLYLEHLNLLFVGFVQILMAFELGRLQNRSFTKTRSCYGICMKVKILRVYDFKLNVVSRCPALCKQRVCCFGDFVLLFRCVILVVPLLKQFMCFNKIMYVPTWFRLFRGCGAWECNF